MVRVCKRCGDTSHFFRDCVASVPLPNWQEPLGGRENLPLREGKAAPAAEEQVLRSEKGERHRCFSVWITATFLAPSVPEGCGAFHHHSVLDVAGGKGHLSRHLVDLNDGIECIVVDPYAGEGRDPSVLSSKNHGGEAIEDVSDVKSHKAVKVEAGGEERPCGAVTFLEATLEEAVSSCVDVMDRTSLIVGLHPDEATENIIDTALRLQKPFAVIPCCVFPHLFTRHLKNGARVKKYGNLIDYLCEKDARIRKTTLPFQGRHTVLFMTAADYSEGG